MAKISSDRIYGPLSAIHIELLKEKLDTINSDYTVFTDDDRLSEAKSRKIEIPGQFSSPYKSFGFVEEFLFIQIPLKDIPFIRADLVKLGFEQSTTTEVEDLLDATSHVKPGRKSKYFFLSGLILLLFILAILFAKNLTFDQLLHFRK